MVAVVAKDQAAAVGRGGRDPRTNPNQPDLEELLKRSQDKLKQVMRKARVLPGSIVFLIMVVLAGLVGFYAFTFKVDPDEMGVVMRFGKVNRQEPPGLHFRLPYPIEEVRKPKVTAVNSIEIGMRLSEGRRGYSGTLREIPEESLMLTGDENIVDIHFVVQWRIKDAQNYLFNIQNRMPPPRTWRESAMREVVGQSNIQPIMTRAREETAEAVKKIIQDVLNSYNSGIEVTGVLLQKLDPPTLVIDAFPDVQAARADRERLQNKRRPMRAGCCRRRAARRSKFCRLPAVIVSKRWRKPTARPRALTRCSRNTRKRPTSHAAASISKPWNACSAASIRSSSTARPARASCPTCRSTRCRSAEGGPESCSRLFQPSSW